MKNNSSKLIWVIVILLIVFGTMVYFYLKPTGDNSNGNASNIREVQVGTGNIEKSITGSRRSIF